ncbi:MAG: hypothetical protein KME43_19925 [Myxacorys chilensis ATA2-1-KO14]|jgi:hypothetical protein|nr:hypothetical protein [Myxacorys chilensis ATA2-1-KO14]
MQGSKKLIPDGTNSTQSGYFRDLRNRDVECVDLPNIVPIKKGIYFWQFQLSLEGFDLPSFQVAMGEGKTLYQKTVGF